MLSFLSLPALLLSMTREVKGLPKVAVLFLLLLLLPFGGYLIRQQPLFSAYLCSSCDGEAVWGCCCLFCGVVELEISHKEETADRLGVQHNKKQWARFLFSYIYIYIYLCVYEDVRVCVRVSVCKRNSFFRLGELSWRLCLDTKPNESCALSGLKRRASQTLSINFK